MYRQLNSCPIFWDVALGTYEYWKTRLMSDLVKEGMTILDIGANEGYYSLLFARLMRDNGRVLAFEPDPSNSRLLRRNIEANGYQCIELHEYALSDGEGETTFYPGGGVGSLVHTTTPLAYFASPSQPVTVRTRTLDNVLREANIKNVDLMKIDVEGADLLVLKGAKRTLETTNVRILMDVDVSGDERTELFDLLHSSGFSLYRIGKGLKPIDFANGSPIPSCLEPVKSPKVAHGSSSVLSSTKSRFKNMAPPRLRSVLSVLIVILCRYLSIPVGWFRAPQEIREIYAVKSGDAPQSR
jgi:FkbM family methyltransferase